MYLHGWLMREGWLIDPDNFWIYRFHHDPKAWFRDPKIFVDKGHTIPNNPPLLKERRYLRKPDAEQFWHSLQKQGWKRLHSPAWGAAAQP